MSNPIATPGGEVGIPANLAQGYYQTALTAAEDVIKSGNTSYNSTSQMTGDAIFMKPFP